MKEMINPSSNDEILRSGDNLDMECGATRELMNVRDVGGKNP
jgi:hypothetical protein